MEVHWVSAAGVERHDVQELELLLAREDGFVWLDIPRRGEPAAEVLSEVFGFHRLAVRDCHEQNQVPKGHAYADHQFVVLHAPELGQAGRIDLLELAQFVGQRYLVTVHGPVPLGVPIEAALRETGLVLKRIECGHFRPRSSAELS